MSLLNIAIKEFEVGVRTKRFYATLALFLVIAVVMTKMMGVFVEEVGSYKTPFQALFFSSLSTAFNYGLSLFAILLGATAINQEIKDGTIKVLYSKPIYRDTIIFGKVLGGVISIAFVVGLFYAFMIALALIFGKPITSYDISRLLVIYPFTILYGIVMYSLGLLFSVIIKSPTNSLLAGIFAFLFLAIIIPSIIAPIIALAIAGLPHFSEAPMDNSTTVLESQEYQQWMDRYYSAYIKVIAISLPYHFEEICEMIFGRKTTEDILSSLSGVIEESGGNEISFVEDRSILESLSLVVNDIVVLLIGLFLFLVPSYVKFAKIDLR
ncbi:ABC transporter permease [Pyrococcus sp. ST04]|uniref:ABC transporter permease n=1 Tax=Pyrococcus sp. ST04 TaxID=1183377 RepID=UPI0002605AEF|nr:ABC transporter permease [Pyrococcus sp. ST04]AFK22794.1 putative ABC-2 type transport system permease [Pyrococcus sp. ST04]